MFKYAAENTINNTLKYPNKHIQHKLPLGEDIQYIWQCGVADKEDTEQSINSTL